MGQLIKKNYSEVKKHVGAIHCSNTLSLLQRKISNALLYHAYPELSSKDEHTITIKQLCNIIGYSGNNHAVIKQALKDLISCVIEWNVVDEVTGEEDWTASAIIASAHIKGSNCSYAYSPRMRALLHSPSMYGKINLIIQSKFRSNYGLALYENCVRYKGLPYTKWFELEMFRKLMGVPVDKYEVFRDFKKRVIDKSVEEVNTYSDLIVTPEINRRGNQVISLRFQLKEREKKKWLGSKLKEQGRVELLPQESSLSLKLKQDYGLTNNQIFSLLEEYQEEYILEKVKVVETSNSFIEGKIDKLAAYLMKAIKNDYQPSKTSNEIIIQTKKNNLLEEQTKRNEKRLHEDLERNYLHYVTTYAEQVINSFDSGQFKQLTEQFEASLIESNNIFGLNNYKKEGISNGIVRALFRTYLKINHEKLFTQLISYEEFVKNHYNQEMGQVGLPL